jgi:hypothetical protein
VKKLSLLLWLMVFMSIGRGVADFVDARFGALRAYQDQATAIAKALRHKPPFEEIPGHIVNVSYRLLSIECEDPYELRIAAVQSVHFQKGSQLGNLVGRKIAQTRQDVLMIKNGDQWEISELEQGVTEVTDFRGAF